MCEAHIPSRRQKTADSKMLILPGCQNTISNRKQRIDTHKIGYVHLTVIVYLPDYYLRLYAHQQISTQGLISHSRRQLKQYIC